MSFLRVMLAPMKKPAADFSGRAQIKMLPDLW